MNIQSICIFYFSGTGNTKIVTNLFKEEFEKKGIYVKVIAIEDLFKKNVPLEIKKYDLLGFGHPVHAFNAPKFFFNFVNSLPKVKNKDVFTFKTAGDPIFNSGATTMLRKHLKRRGYKVFNENLIVMPANVFIKYNNEFVKQLYNTAIKKVKKMSEDILAKKKKLQKNNIFLSIFTFFFSRMESLGTKSLGKYFKVLDTCTLCKLCVNICPTDNIFEEDQKIKFGEKCTFCLRCVYSCPKNSISLRYFKFFILKDGYNIQNIINDPKIKGDFINSKTKGFFKHFYKYIAGE
ncbi:MAG: EFR1 family ferrodoxin [Promethearchaeota archaeon]